MTYAINKNVFKYRKGFIVGIVLSLFMVLSMNALNMTAHYAMGLKEIELTKYYQSRDTVIDSKTGIVFNEYMQNHKEIPNEEMPYYKKVVNEANEIMKQYYGK